MQIKHYFEVLGKTNTKCILQLPIVTGIVEITLNRKCKHHDIKNSLNKALRPGHITGTFLE